MAVSGIGGGMSAYTGVLSTSTQNSAVQDASATRQTEQLRQRQEQQSESVQSTSSGAYTNAEGQRVGMTVSEVA